MKRRLLESLVLFLVAMMPLLPAKFRNAEGVETVAVSTAEESVQEASGAGDGAVVAAEDGEAEESAEEEFKEKGRFSSFHLDQLEFSEDFDWHRDWWKVLLLSLGVILVLLLAVRLCMNLLKFGGMLICLAISACISVALQPVVLEWVEDLAPENLTQIVPPAYLAYLVAFVIGLIVSMLVAGFVRRLCKKKQ